MFFLSQSLHVYKRNNPRTQHKLFTSLLQDEKRNWNDKRKKKALANILHYKIWIY